MSNATDIFNAVRTRISTVLGPNYREHPNLFSVDDLDAISLENGYSVVLLDSSERSPQANAIFLERKMRVFITHRTYSSDPRDGKAQVTLGTVYDKESLIIDDLRNWKDTVIGLISLLPTTESTIEQRFDDEDSFIVNELNFDILYLNKN